MKNIIFLAFLFPVISFAGEVTTGGGVRPRLDANLAPQMVEYIKSVNVLQNGNLQIEYKSSANFQIENHVVNSLELDPAVLDAIRRSFETKEWQVIPNEN